MYEHSSSPKKGAMTGELCKSLEGFEELVGGAAGLATVGLTLYWTGEQTCFLCEKVPYIWLLLNKEIQQQNSV